MYPGPSGSAENHKKGYCSDGVKQNMEQSSQNEDPPRDNKPTSCTPAQWPQPHGIFTHGTHFNAFAFLTKIREMYEKVVIEDDSGELLMEHEAFATLLFQRTVIHEGVVLFKLFSLEHSDPISEGLVVVREDGNYLRVDCLRDNVPDLTA
jgi:hypothetical protein